MRIVCFASRFHTNLYYRMKALQDDGHQVLAAVLYKGQSEYYKEIKVVELGYSSGTLLFQRLMSCVKRSYLKSDLELVLQRPSHKMVHEIFESFNPDLVLIKAYQDLFCESVLNVAKKRDVPSFLLTQTKKSHIKGSSFFLKLYLNHLQKRGVRGYITPIKINRDNFKALGIEPVTYLPFVFPAPDYKKEYCKDGRIAILSIGKFVSRKGQLLLLKAFSSLAQKYPFITLTLLGERADESYVRELLSFVKEHSLEEKVFFKYNLPYEKALDEYTAHDLYILPSHDEPAAYSIVEAMAYKLPVICSDDNGTSCYIVEGENGFIFRKKDGADLEQKIETVICKKEALVKMGKKGYELAVAKHSLAVYSDFFKTLNTNDAASQAKQDRK